MKRGNEIGDGDIGNSEFKKVCVRTDSGNEAENDDVFGGLIYDDFENLNFGGLGDSSKWDFDINFDMIFGDKSVNGNSVDVVDIPSGVDVIHIDSDSEAEVEIKGSNNGVENLNLGLGMIGVGNFVAGSFVDGERRFTREEKGKFEVVDPWLSLAHNGPTGLNMLANSDDSVGASGPQEEIELLVWPEMAERALRQDEEDLRYREERALRRAEEALRYREERAHRRAEEALRHREESWKETAKRLARTNFQDQEQPLPAESPVEHLGSCPGPFSEALRIVRERNSKGVAVVDWKPSMGIRDTSVTAPFVPSLFDLSVKALAENAERMVSLEVVPDNLRERLCDRLCDISKMDARFMNLLVEGCPTEIRIKNCSWLTDEQFQKLFENSWMKNLRVLQLDLCGQCMLDYAFKDLSRSPNSFSSLAILSLRGACRLSDDGLKSLLMAARSLQSINLGHCNLLTSDAIRFIADFLGSNLKELFIDDCQKINLMLVLSSFHKFSSLEVLSVAGINSVTDQFIVEVVTVCRNIRELNLADCIKLTDISMKAIGSNCADLSSLNISSIPKLTNVGMEYIANGCRSIQKLKLCCNEFSDEAMAAYIETSGESLTELLLNHMTKVGPNTAMSLAKRSRKLLSLDISWCRKISNEALGLIVDSCSSLKLLKVFGCRQITNVFLNGHSNQGVRIIGLNLTPVLDHVNFLEPKGVLLRYSPLMSSQ